VEALRDWIRRRRPYGEPPGSSAWRPACGRAGGRGNRPGRSRPYSAAGPGKDKALFTLSPFSVPIFFPLSPFSFIFFRGAHTALP
jgi:hypothetical protein